VDPQIKFYSDSSNKLSQLLNDSTDELDSKLDVFNQIFMIMTSELEEKNFRDEKYIEAPEQKAVIFVFVFGNYETNLHTTYYKQESTSYNRTQPYVRSTSF
jgi:hypothetical protein